MWFYTFIRCTTSGTTAPPPTATRHLRKNKFARVRINRARPPRPPSSGDRVCVPVVAHTVPALHSYIYYIIYAERKSKRISIQKEWAKKNKSPAHSRGSTRGAISGVNGLFGEGGGGRATIPTAVWFDRVPHGRRGGFAYRPPRGAESKRIRFRRWRRRDSTWARPAHPPPGRHAPWTQRRGWRFIPSRSAPTNVSTAFVLRVGVVVGGACSDPLPRPPPSSELR